MEGQGLVRVLEPGGLAPWDPAPAGPVFAAVQLGLEGVEAVAGAAAG